MRRASNNTLRDKYLGFHNPTQHFFESKNKLAPSLPIIAVDIGSRNGPFDVDQLSSYSSFFCFEPNKDEFSKLTDKASKMSSPPACGELRHFPAAVCGHSGNTTLNVSRRPGATSTLEPNVEVLKHFAADHWSELADILKRENVPAVTLPEFTKKAKLSHIDFLKLDTQGNELDILKSSEEILNNVGVVKVEVEFIQMYEGQALFDEVASYLRGKDFELIDIEVVPACRRFHHFSRLRPSAYRLVWADLVMVRSPFDTSDSRLIAKAAVLAAMGYTDISCYMVRLAHGENEAFCKAFERMALDMLKPKTWKSRFRSFLERKLGLLVSRYNWRTGQQVESLR